MRRKYNWVNTTVIGKDIDSKPVEFFGGIPFAEPPIGKLRFKPPVLKSSLDVPTFNATEFGASCLQPGVKDPTTISEDCLFMNVFRPAGTPPNTSLPVQVFLYGGGFLVETPFRLDASTFVARSIARGTPIIHVGFTHRLGVVGLPTGAEAAEKGAVNLALKDQLAAFEWVKANIGSFGGDPEKVTMNGWSGGGVTLSMHFLNGQAEKYARAAIFSSGTSILVYNATSHQQRWDDFVHAIPQCSSYPKGQSLDCLRSEEINSTQMLTAMNTAVSKSGQQLPWDLVLDGEDGLVPGLPVDLYQQGRFSRLPFISGNVIDEGTRFSWNITDEQTLKEAIVANFTTNKPAEVEALRKAVDKLMVLYPNSPALGSPFNTGNETFGFNSLYKRYGAIIGDLLFQSPRRLWTETASKSGVKLFSYQFKFPESVTVPATGVVHGADLPYVWGFPTISGSADGTQLNEQIMDYWISFITSLDPNDGLGTERPDWPLYTPERKAILEINGPNNMTTTVPGDWKQDNHREQQIHFINVNAGLFRH
ncbi:hypothetical protein E1B28_002137 [Marasmius oreades]|uniref:Carboxylesterase type B domain-containing protein n=1 Tax=Marasmius oreades TaxID=181124 RepID=A0A9P7UL79_9AGAR|nr:uncharacterized protein E1B28_002137 [Marasmius oreades]KAG7086180.1 hypothetical protein E1B28_002137 [Marasmius oreades]